MALNIKNREAEKLAAAVAAMTGKSKTRAVKVARGQAIHRFLEQEVWPQVPRKMLGRRVTRRERAKILGYGPEGV
jgi:antitoxin VapB